MHERTISTSMGSFLNLLGFNFSIIYASITSRNVSEYGEIVEQINTMNLLFAIITSLAFLFCLTMIRNKPATPPSASAV
jgi:FLVCR family feline leukemia virus subgroup C receptor-related protein